MKYTRNTLCLIFGFVLGYLTTNLNKKYNKPPNYQYNCKNYYIKNFTITPFVIKKTNNRDSLKKNYILIGGPLRCQTKQ